MRFDPAILDEIRARLAVSTVVGRSVAWDRRKSNVPKGDYWACCPFHGEKTPSFHVDDRKGRYHCFGCKAGGDIFTFLVQHEGLQFPEAVERLAGEAGVKLPEPTREDRHRQQVRASLYDVMTAAAEFYVERLGSAQGRTARDYLTSRQIPPAQVKQFTVGYAPGERFGLRNHLAGKGITNEQMVEAGLIISVEGVDNPYDRFRDRLMFPIRDSRGRIIAFGGRALNSEAMAKYLNSPDTPIFKKGSALYNYERARGEAHRTSQLVVVEGYVDVIAMDRAGVPQTVAPLGTALTVDQLSLLWRTVPEPLLCFDGDAAGVKAAYRALDLALPHLSPGYSLSFCFLPDRLDPDDLLKQRGATAVRDALDDRQSLLDVLWSRAMAANDRATPERAAQFERDLFQAVEQISDGTVKAHYRASLRQRCNELFGAAPKRAAAAATRGKGAWRVGQPGTALLSSLTALEKETSHSRVLREEGCYDE